MSSHLRMVVFLSLGLLLVFGWHFGTVFGAFGSPPETRGAFFIRFGVIVAAFVIASTVTAIIISSRDEDAVMPDEREEKIELLAERAGLIAVYGGMVLLMWFVFTPMTPIQVANGLLGIMCLAEIVKVAWGLFRMRGRV